MTKALATSDRENLLHDIDKITALAVGYNSREVLANSLSPFYGRMQIVVVDNASSDGSVAFLKQDFPDIDIIENQRNLGYGTGFNAGLARVKTPYILALSPDSEFSIEKLEQLYGFAEAFDNSAMTSPALDVPGHGNENWVMGPGELNHRKASFEGVGPFCSWFSSGALCLYRTEMLRAIGGFDENIFLYHEDLDLCLRLRRAGYSIVSIPGIAATHFNSGSAPPSVKLHWRKEWNFAWSRLYVTNKFAGRHAMLRLAFKLISIRGPKSLFYAATINRKRFVRDFSSTLGALAFLMGRRPNPKS